MATKHGLPLSGDRVSPPVELTAKMRRFLRAQKTRLAINTDKIETYDKQFVPRCAHLWRVSKYTYFRKGRCSSNRIKVARKSFSSKGPGGFTKQPVQSIGFVFLIPHEVSSSQIILRLPLGVLAAPTGTLKHSLRNAPPLGLL